MDNDTVRVAAALRLGSTICRPHACQHCISEVDHFSVHGLSCRMCESRHFRHSALNDIIHCALASAKVPSRLEPTGIYRSDKKRPDGITMVPWERGKLMVWNVMCSYTFASSYAAAASREPGAVAALAEERIVAKYAHLGPMHLFTPVAVETTGVIGQLTRVFLKDLGRRLCM